MRIAIVSDIHGNRTAFEAVLDDLRQTSPDIVFHGGDLADAGASPAEIVDRIRDLGWLGVMGNTDEMLVRPASLLEFAEQSPGLQPLVAVIEEMAAATREELGQERLAWLSGLPRSLDYGPMTLIHGTPESSWRAPAPEVSDADLELIYGSLDKPVAVYAHIHRPFVRNVPGRMIANTGSVSLSYDGDCRAAYLLLDASTAGDLQMPYLTVRRVEYGMDREIHALSACALPHADWISKILKSGRPQMP
jgi:predicted phosphodiesterase